MTKLTDQEIAEFVESESRWAREGDALVAQFEFKNFAEAVKFVNQVAEAAEQANHHPDIDIRWNKVRLVLSTHSEGGITEKDLDLARQFISS